MNEFFQQFLDTIVTYVPGALAALGILIGGWILARVIAAIIRGGLKRTGLDERLAKIIRGEAGEGEPLDIARWVSQVVYWLIMLFVIVAFLQALNLTIVAEPINQLLNQVLSYLPQLLGAIILLFVAWLIASTLKFIVGRALRMAKFDERFSPQTSLNDVDESSTNAISSQTDLEDADVSFTNAISSVVYWLVFLLFLPAILGALGIEGLLTPVQGVVNGILAVVPNILGAAVILFVGWLAARFVRQIVTNLLAGMGADRLGARIGLENALGGQKLSQILGMLLYVVILIPIIISALNALQIQAVSDPASAMLTTILNALPAIFGAMLLIGIAYFVARLVSSFVTNLLTSIGFDKVLSWVGLGSMTPEGGQTPSQIIGYLTTVAIMLFAVIASANLLGFTILAQLVSNFLVAAGGVLLALLIFGLGLYLAGLAERVIRDTGGSQAQFLAPVARISIIVFSGALALRETGIAQDIVNMTFAIVFGTVAVAAALAFGLGSREIAARELEKWLDRNRK